MILLWFYWSYNFELLPVMNDQLHTLSDLMVRLNLSKY